MTKKEAVEVLQKNYPDSCYSMLQEAVDMAIEALSEEQKTKCIVQIKIDQDDIEDFVNEKVNEMVEKMKGSNIKWIPVSEKPKEEKKEYLVQLDSGGMCSCRWTNVNPFWTDLTTDWHWNIFDIPQYCKVVAWMDLEPYREDYET